MREGLALTLAALIGVVGCRSRKAQPDAATDPIDMVYARYKADHTWIDPDTSQPIPVEPPTNTGSFATCAHCNYDICYADLPIKHKLRVDTDDDLVRMMPWLRDQDACVRSVAEYVLWPKLGLPGDALSVSVQDREAYAYHSIVHALKVRLDRRKAVYDAKLFDGLLLSFTERDFPALMHGTWEQDIHEEHEQLIAEIGPNTIRGTVKPIPPDPQHPERTWLDKYDDDGLSVNPNEQFEISARSERSHTRHYLVSPVTKDLVWLADSNEGGQLDERAISGGNVIRWTKMRRARAR